MGPKLAGRLQCMVAQYKRIRVEHSAAHSGLYDACRDFLSPRPFQKCEVCTSQNTSWSCQQNNKYDTVSVSNNLQSLCRLLAWLVTPVLAHCECTLATWLPYGVRAPFDMVFSSFKE